MTDNSASNGETPTPAPVKAVVPGNPALLEWPRDEWGTLSPLRTELTQAAGRIRGSAEKHKLFLATLGYAAQHAQARLESDKQALIKEGQDEADRIANVNRTARVYGRAVA